MPLYFQNSRGMTATMSGATLLPIVIGIIVSVILSGYLTSIVGYYNPFMLATSVMTPVANGLLTTLNRTTPIWKLVIFQGLLGVGAGVGFQGPQVAVQTVLSNKDTPVGIGIIQFAQGIGPAIFIAVSQSIFLTQFEKELRTSGLTDKITGLILHGTSPPSLSMDTQDKERVSAAYAQSLTRTFYLPVTLSCLSAIGASGMEWRSVKSDRLIEGS
jgi:MFS family permease